MSIKSFGNPLWNGTTLLMISTLIEVGVYVIYRNIHFGFYMEKLSIQNATVKFESRISQQFTKE